MNRQTPVTTALVSAVLLLILAGCGDNTRNLLAPGEEGLAKVQAPDVAPEVTAQLRQITRAIALALDVDAARKTVRDAMRDSPWGEHKLVLQDFVETEQGMVLVSGVASAMGITIEGVHSRIGALPELDFYVPIPEQRQSWRGTPGVFVVSMLNLDDGPYYAFDRHGREVPDILGPSFGTTPIIVLHPAERKGLRTASDTPGDPDLIETPPLEAASRTSPPAASHEAGTTFIDEIRIYDCEGALAGDMEIEVVAEFYSEVGTLVGSDSWYEPDFTEPTTCDGSTYSAQFPHEKVIAHVLPDSSIHSINLHVWERDSGSGDDDWGERDYLWDDRTQLRSIFHSGEQKAAIELDWSPIAPSEYTSFILPSGGVTINISEFAEVEAWAYDQYGYRIAGQSVDTWSIAPTGVITFASTQDMSARVEGQNSGEAYVYAEIDNVADSVLITVDCDPEDPDCPA